MWERFAWGNWKKVSVSGTPRWIEVNSISHKLKWARPEWGRLTLRGRTAGGEIIYSQTQGEGLDKAGDVGPSIH